jgi:hypothetical protein
MLYNGIENNNHKAKILLAKIGRKKTKCIAVFFPTNLFHLGLSSSTYISMKIARQTNV